MRRVADNQQASEAAMNFDGRGQYHSPTALEHLIGDFNPWQSHDQRVGRVRVTSLFEDCRFGRQKRAQRACIVD